MIPADIANAITVAQVPIILVPCPLLPSPLVPSGSDQPYTQKVMAHDMHLEKQKKAQLYVLSCYNLDLRNFTSY